jgi:truncated hemoglobin YjbI
VLAAGLCERLRASPRLHEFFVDTPRARLEARLVDFLCALLGDRLGDWRGRDLRAAHVELAITDRDLDAFLALFSETLGAAGVSVALIGDVLRRIETVRIAVVSADEGGSR